MTQDTGTLLAWLKADGESVAKGEPIVEIETDKATVEIEAPASGFLGGVLANEGDVIPVGQTIAWILALGESVPQQMREDQTGSLPSSDAQPAIPSASIDRPESRGGGARLSPASPKARRLAYERGVDVKSLIGTGPGGAVLAADVLAAETEPEVVEPRSLEPSTVWKVMVDRVSQSWTDAPHFYLVREVYAGRLIEWRERIQERIEPKPTYTDLLVKLVAVALGRHQRVNASWRDARIVLHEEINIGLAVAVEDGLVVPVIHRADRLSLGQIGARRQSLVSRAQAGKLSPGDLSHGTFTISNLGMYGVDAFNAVINPPQAAILAVGRIAERVVPVDGQPAVQPMMILSLSFDHRVIDGARGAQFLETLSALIEEPLLLLG
jgi:pyruvate dehydrogenase E2 component (dihydrolipoamide acetyltransferase)